VSALTLTRTRIQTYWYELTMGGLVLIGVVLRFWELGQPYLSYDESFTALAAQLPLGRLIAATAGDVHPPASYLIMWAFTHLVGLSPLTLRIPGAIAGALALWYVPAIARRLNLGLAATVAAMALFALSPFQIHYAQDARMYAWLQLAVLGAVLAALERRYLLMAAWLTLALWSHNYGLIYLAVLAPAVMLREFALPVHSAVDPTAPWIEPAPSSKYKLAAVALALPVLAWLPWAAVVVSQMHTLSTGYWIPPLTLGQWLYPFFALAWSVALPLNLTELGAIVLFGFLAFALWKGRRDQRLLVWLTLGPPLLAGVASLVWHPIYLFRGLIGVAAPMWLLIGWAIAHRTSWAPRVWAAAVLGTLLVAGLVNRGQALSDRLGENQVVIDLVAAGYQPGDIVYHGNVGSLTGFEAMGPAGLDNYLMPVQPGSVGVLTPQTRTAMGFCEGPLLPTLATNCGLKPWRRAWLVWGASQTISGVEDAAIAALLVRYPNEKLLDIHDVYKGPLPLDGGLWLLTNP
jgi:hypothetical protein